MIRVQLQGDQRLRRYTRAATTSMAASVGLAALVFWIDANVGLLTLVPGWPVSTGEGVMALPAADAGDSAHEPAASEVSVSVAATPTASASPGSVPRRSDACPRALELLGRLPTSLRFTSLSGRAIEAGGEYTLEGLSGADDIATLLSYLDTLKSLPSRVNLSYWREGGKTTEDTYRFTFHGTLANASAAETAREATVADVTALLAQVTASAARAGLDSLMTRGPIRLGLGDGLALVRQKHWAVGSYGQIRSFAQALGPGTGGEAMLNELVIVPGHGSRSGGQELQMYAVVDVVVDSAAMR